MEKVINILTYLYRNYPNSNQLSYSRTMKILYLIEWRFAITKFEKLTDINWTLTRFGPYYDKLIQIFEDSQNFDIITKFDDHNNQLLIIKFLRKSEKLPLKEDTEEVIDFVIKHVSELKWSELNNIVNSTYGVINSKSNEIIDVVQLAKKYKNV
ncbi:SocA family protein [Antarcticibacterium sp. 1MA-6-2]|uniref:SocA family protein n=1 Tax=Antarcticibacterium sp. 1MA-6-2 TaxID=2908210 RepID=UPI001F2D5F6E|nr:SocA family protein [Antarcticibacterium sp. 1MA-6-2]UJH92722.1 SocA family protein [Antarcticibacterium sp. 1MA-6-2]